MVQISQGTHHKIENKTLESKVQYGAFGQDNIVRVEDNLTEINRYKSNVY